MSRVTSKLQVTIPKVVADRYGIEPGDDIAFIPAGETIRLVPGVVAEPPAVARRLELFDQATRRQRARQRGRAPRRTRTRGTRGWTREELYTRGSAG